MPSFILESQLLHFFNSCFCCIFKKKRLSANGSKIRVRRSISWDLALLAHFAHLDSVIEFQEKLKLVRVKLLSCKTDCRTERFWKNKFLLKFGMHKFKIYSSTVLIQMKTLNQPKLQLVCSFKTCNNRTNNKRKSSFQVTLTLPECIISMLFPYNWYNG